MDRRKFILASGAVAFHLPLLEGLLSSSEARAQASEPEKFLLIFKTSSGHGPNLWPMDAADLTADLLSKYSSSALGPYASKMLIPRGWDHWIRKNQAGCSHAETCSMLLTGGAFTGSSGNAHALAQSIDYAISQKIHSADPLLFNATAKCNRSEEKTPKLSWSGNGQELPYTRNPYDAYNDLIKRIGTGSSTTQSAPKQVDLLRNSAIDSVKNELTALSKNPKLSAADVKRLENHFANVRTLEVKLGTMAKNSPTISEDSKNRIATTKGWAGGWGDNGTQGDVAKMFMDIFQLYVATGQRRIGTLALGAFIDMTEYKINGKMAGWTHHENTHYDINTNEWHHTKEEGKAAMIAHDKMTVDLFKYFCDTINAVPISAGKTLLDYGTLVWTNDMGCGDHLEGDLQNIMVGSMNGTFKTGKVLDFYDRNGGGFTQKDQQHYNGIPNNRFLASLGAAMGLRGGDGGPLRDFNSQGDGSRQGIVNELFAKVPS